MNLLADHVRWATELGVSGINFQPLDEWTQETKEELWIQPQRYEELERMASQLIALRRAGYPLMNNETSLRMLVPHFRKEKAPPEAMPCRVGLRNFFIRTNGDVELCFFFPPIGNIAQQSAKEIWHGLKATLIRKQTVKCERLCLHTCLSQKSMKDRIATGATLLGLVRSKRGKTQQK